MKTDFLAPLNGPNIDPESLDSDFLAVELATKDDGRRTGIHRMPVVNDYIFEDEFRRSH